MDKFGMQEHMNKIGSDYDPSPKGRDSMVLDPDRPLNPINVINGVTMTTDPPKKKEAKK